MKLTSIAPLPLTEVLETSHTGRTDGLFVLGERITDGLVIGTSEGVPLFANQAMSEITGHTRAELLRMPLQELILDEEFSNLMAGFPSQLQSEAGPSTKVVKIGKKSGSELRTEVTVSSADWRGQTVVLVFVHRSVEESQAGKHLLQLNDALIRLGTNAHLNIEKLVHTCGELLGASCVLFSELSEGQLVTKHSCGLPEGLEHNWEPEGRVCNSLVERGLTTGIHLVKRLQQTTYRKTDPYVEPLAAERYVGHLVTSYGKMAGVLGVFYRKGDRRHLKEDSIVLALIARAIGGEMERQQSHVHLQRSSQRLLKAMETTILAMARMTEMRDPYTAGHQQRVATLAAAIAEEMGLDEDQINGIRLAGVIHDIGKIAVPAEILSRPGRLNDIEFAIIKTHPQVGYRILKHIEFPWPVAQIVLQHHEQIDGSGYPLGLRGDDILLEARILAVADFVEATASHRPYRPALGLDLALEEMGRAAGSHLDIVATQACMRLFKERGFDFEQ